MEDEGLNDTEREYLVFFEEEDYIFLKNYIKLIKNGSATIGLIQSEQTKVVNLLVKQPYPTLQLLLLNLEKSKFLITKTISAALKVYITENKNELSSNFLSFLANFPDSILEANSVRQSLFDDLVNRVFDV